MTHACCDACPARLEECIGLGEDKTEDEDDAKDTERKTAARMTELVGAIGA